MSRPYAKRPRCRKWMPIAGEYCGRPEGHRGWCVSADALAWTKAYIYAKRRAAA